MADTPAAPDPDASYHVFTLSKRVGDSARGFLEVVKIPKELRVRDIKGVKLTIGEDGVSFALETVIAVLCKASGSDPDLFDEIPAPDMLPMAVAVMGELGKSLATSTMFSATSAVSSTSSPAK